MKKVIDFIKEHNYLMILLIFIGFSISLGLTYSNFIVTSNNHKAAEMYIGELKYSMEIDNESINTLTVPTGETIVDVKVNNLNPVDTYYKLLYLKNTNITVKYYESTKDTDDVVTTYNKPNDSITSSNSNIVKLLITNSSTSSQNIALTMKGGYITNTLEDIIAPSTYSEITLVETPSTNTYFCKTNDTLTQGLQYINGQYTYAYKQEGIYASSGLSWSTISNNGWGVQLTDKASTEAVTSNLCTYINNKPVISMSYMFYNSQATILDVTNLNTTNVKNMGSMFSESKATTLDLSNFNTSKVTDMANMFSQSQAAALDLSSFDTSKVTTMYYMFYGSQATTLNVSNFDTSNVTNMNSMFEGSQATIIDVSNFDTSKVTTMYQMFRDSQATTLNLSNFNTSKVTSMYGMFYESQATTLDLSSFDTSKVYDMSYMFCYSQASTLDLSSFNTSNVTKMNNMFSQSQATALDLSNFDTSNVVSMYRMFDNSKATILDISNFDTSNVTNMNSMFEGSQATIIDVSNFDTSNVTNMNCIFKNTKATTLDVSNFDTSKVTNMGGMFYNSKATTIKGLSNFDTSNVTSMNGMFYWTQVTTLDLSSFDTSNVTGMNGMFYFSTKLTTIYVSNKFNTDNVTDSSNMFYYTTKLVGGSGTKYNSSYVDKTYARIDGGTSNPGYFTDVSQKPSTFDTDDWATIVKSVKEGNTRKYKVGDTKTIDMGRYGTHTLRIANTSTPSECSTSGFSQTACGFVLEFADIITTNKMNNTDTNVGGWPASSMRTFVNNDIYNALPTDLKNGIIDTTVVSSHGESDSSNFTSIDKLYLLATAEIFAQGTSNTISKDTARDVTRQLDYYKNEGVTTNNSSKAIKMHNSSASFWWLRSAWSNANDIFYFVGSNGVWSNHYASYTSGTSPAFRMR